MATVRFLRTFVPATLLAVSSAVSTLAAVPAFASPTTGNAPAHVRHGDHDDKKFPMPGAEFKQKVDARLAKARERMESHASKLPADKAGELRAKFDAGLQKINEEVQKVVADGTVTKEEAKEVRETVRAVMPHGQHHHDKNAARQANANK